MSRVGPAVTTLAVGDHVALATLGQCGACPACDSGRPTLCRDTFGKRPTPFRVKGVPYHNFANLSTFAERIVVKANQAIPIPKEVPFASACLIGCGVLINYAILLVTVSLTFWLGAAQGIEGSYFTLMEFSRLPREAFKGAARVLFVWLLPAVVVSNVPAVALIRGFDLLNAFWLAAATVAWLALAIWAFHRGLRRYASASS